VLSHRWSSAGRGQQLAAEISWRSSPASSWLSSAHP